MSISKPKNSLFYRYDFWLGGHRFHGPTECKARKQAKAVEAVAREKAKATVNAVKRSRASLLIDDVAARLWIAANAGVKDRAAPDWTSLVASNYTFESRGRTSRRHRHGPRACSGYGVSSPSETSGKRH
jgi:hypothetical protein